MQKYGYLFAGVLWMLGSGIWLLMGMQELQSGSADALTYLQILASFLFFVSGIKAFGQHRKKRE